MSGLFITSIGTDSGKTLVSCALLHQMFKAGLQVRAIKPIATGQANIKYNDPVRLLRAMGMPQHPSAIQKICPWQYDDPIAPHIAARRTGNYIIWRELVDFCLHAVAREGTTIIEGAGGIMCPVDRDHTMLDLMVVLNIPVVLVTNNYLGSISHSLTALKVLEMKRVQLAAIIVSESLESAVDKEEMLRILKQASYMEHPIFWIDRLADDIDNYKHSPSFEALWKILPNS